MALLAVCLIPGVNCSPGSKAKNKATNENSNQFISSDTVNILNHNLNTVTVNTLVKSEQNCFSTTNIDQTMDFSRCKIAGNVNITGKQIAYVQVKFSCMNISKVQSQIGQAMMQEMMADLQSSFNAKVLNEMDTKAEAKAVTNGIFAPSSSASNDVNNINKLTVVNNTNKNIQNIVANAINSNFNAENIQNCISNTNINQNFLMTDCEIFGDLNNNLTQSASVTNLLNCVSSGNSANNIIQNIISDLGLKTSSSTIIDAENKMKNDLSATAISTGLTLPSLGTIGSILCSICCILIIVLVVYLLFSGSSSGDESNYYDLSAEPLIDDFELV